MKAANNKTVPMPQDEFEALVRAANQGDKQSLQELRLLLDSHPEIHQNLGDLAKNVQMTIINLLAGENHLLRETITRQLDDQRKELLGEKYTASERLAVERVLSCWLHVQLAEATYPGVHFDSLPQAKYIAFLKESSQRRFDSALRSLNGLKRVQAITQSLTKKSPQLHVRRA